MSDQLHIQETSPKSGFLKSPDNQHIKGKFNFIHQIDDSDCAAACLAMVAQSCGVDVVLSETRALCGGNASGLEICTAAQKLGLNASFHRAQFSFLENLDQPCIAHWQGNHWVVVLGYKDESVKVADPAAGTYWLTYEEAKESFSGYVCKVLGVDVKGKVIQRSNWLIPCLKPFKNVILPTALLMLLTVSAEMLIPFFIQNLIDERLFEEEATFRWLIFYTGLAGGAVILGQTLQSMLLSKAAIKSESLVLDTLFKKWLAMPVEFFKDRSFRELRLRFENVFKIRHLLQESAGVMLFALLELIAIFAMLEHYGQAIFFTLTLSPAIFLTYLAFSLSRKQAGALKFSTENFMGCLDDLTKGVFAIRASESDIFFRELEKKAKDKMQETVRKNERAIVFCEKGALAVGLSSALFLFYNSGKEYINGESTAGTMMAVLILSTMTINTIYRVLKHRDSFENGAVIYDYLHDVFDVKEESFQNIFEDQPAEVEWDSYALTSELGSNCLNLVIDKKSSCFIYGDSSLISTSLRETIKNYSGSLKLKTDNKEYIVPEDAPNVSCIEEHPHIFNLSVYENIAMSDHYDEKKVKWCLRLVLADDLAENLNYGLETKLTENQLCYEMKMKIVLARTLYRNAPVYMLENLSDFLSKRELLIFGYHLKEHLNDRTVVVIDKDPFLSKYCTKVAIVYNGILKEYDTAENLLKAKNAYSKRVNGTS